MHQSSNYRSEQCINVHQQYNFLEKLGEGYIQQISNNRSFGHIWKVQNNETGAVMACKLVKSGMKKEKSLLLREIKILAGLKGIEGLTQIKAYGQDAQYTFFMMDLYGINLESLRVRMSVLNPSLLVEYSIQIIDRIQALHTAGIVHRDIKPENFVLSRNDDKNIVLIDFGLSKAYSENGKHIEFKEKKGMIGTARYASHNALKGNEQSRRDDLEAIAYMLIYLGQGQLPWMNIREEDKQIKYTKILKMKESVTPEMLAFNLPKVEAFPELLRYAQSLKFEETPDYNHMRNLLRCHHAGRPTPTPSSKAPLMTGARTMREGTVHNKLDVGGQYTQRMPSGFSYSGRSPQDISSLSFGLDEIAEQAQVDHGVLGKTIRFRKPASTSENLHLGEEDCELQMHHYTELRLHQFQQ